jgi:hypothetical protein
LAHEHNLGDSTRLLFRNEALDGNAAERTIVDFTGTNMTKEMLITFDDFDKTFLYEKDVAGASFVPGATWVSAADDGTCVFSGSPIGSYVGTEASKFATVYDAVSGSDKVKLAPAAVDLKVGLWCVKTRRLMNPAVFSLKGCRRCPQFTFYLDHPGCFSFFFFKLNFV